MATACKDPPPRPKQHTCLTRLVFHELHDAPLLGLHAEQASASASVMWGYVRSGHPHGDGRVGARGCRGCSRHRGCRSGQRHGDGRVGARGSRHWRRRGLGWLRDLHWRRRGLGRMLAGHRSDAKTTSSCNSTQLPSYQLEARWLRMCIWPSADTHGTTRGKNPKQRAFRPLTQPHRSWPAQHPCKPTVLAAATH